MKCFNKYLATMLIIVFWSKKEISTSDRNAFLDQLGVKYDDKKQSITIGDEKLNCYECFIKAAKKAEDAGYSKILKQCVKEACKNNLVTQEQENNFMIKTMIEQTR